jgi:hypothetical protein
MAKAGIRLIVRAVRRMRLHVSCHVVASGTEFDGLH